MPAVSAPLQEHLPWIWNACSVEAAENFSTTDKETKARDKRDRTCASAVLYVVSLDGLTWSGDTRWSQFAAAFHRHLPEPLLERSMPKHIAGKERTGITHARSCRNRSTNKKARTPTLILLRSCSVVRSRNESRSRFRFSYTGVAGSQGCR